MPNRHTTEEVHRVVVVGGGFAGLRVVQALKRAPVRITLVDRRNHHVFQPLLYQVATGTLSPANVCAPLRTVLRRQKNVEVIMAEAAGFDPTRQIVRLADGELPYDTLIVAAGSQYNYFGRTWQRFAPCLKSVDDAIEMRGRILSVLEQAERESDTQRRQSLLTFVVIGGGPTGVELAGALAEIARYTVEREFRHIGRDDIKVILVEALSRILSGLPEDLSHKAARSLQRIGVEVRTSCLACAIDSNKVDFQCGGERSSVAARTVFWAAGVRASALAGRLAGATDAEVDRAGRIMVAANLTLPSWPGIFVIGDMAHVTNDRGEPLPALAPVAIQQGKYVARVIRERLQGRVSPPKPFHYRDFGTMATIGRSAAVASFGLVRFNGMAAWLAWLLVHLMQLVTYQNRVLVLIQWAWHYFTFSRNSQLITLERRPGQAPAIGPQNVQAEHKTHGRASNSGDP